MEVKKLLATFRKSKTAQATPDTVRFYESHLKSVTDFLGSRNVTDIEAITYDDVLDYINDMADLGIAHKTINHRVNIIKQLIKLDPNRTFEQYQILDIKKKVVEPKSYMPLTDDQLFKFIDYVMHLDKNHAPNIKKSVIFLLSVQNGIRANEILELKVRDLLLDSKRIKLTHTKCHEVRYAYFNDDTKALMEQYVATFKPTDYLFCGADTPNKKMTRNIIGRYYDIASKKLGFRVTSHILRATFATKTLRQGCNIESVRVMMGHTNIKTTQMYLHMTDEEILKDNIDYNPLTWYNNKINVAKA